MKKEEQEGFVTKKMKAKFGTSKRPTPPPPKKDPLSILDEAQLIVHGDREKTYGHPGKNIKNIARMWSAYLTARLGVEVKLDMEDVCHLMINMKQMRLLNEPTHRDSQVDIGGYLALLARVQEVAA